MGLIFSRRRQKTTIEVLQEIEKLMDDLETGQADKEFSRRRSVGYLIIFAVLLFLGSGFYWYMYLFPQRGLEIRHYLICLLVVSIYPTLVWLFMWTICLWYEQSLNMNERKLTRLRRRKRDILDTVKDKETYKVAKEILERFDPQVRQEKTAKKAREFQQQLAMMRRYASLDGDALRNTPSSPSMKLRNRRNQRSRSPSPSSDPREKCNSEQVLLSLTAPMPEVDATSAVHPPTPQPSPVSTPAVSIIPPTAPRQTMMKPIGPIVGGSTFRTPISNQNQQAIAPQTPFMPAGSSLAPDPQSMMIHTPIRLPRPIIPQNRSALDKMIDYLLGEGPSSRYALICQRCHSHNGMALKEELETMAFRCCYCFAFNPARKLSQPLPPLATMGTDHSEDGGSTPTLTPHHPAPSSTSRPDSPNSRAGAQSSSSPLRHDSSGSRAPSRCSIASLDSTQSVPPFFRPTTNVENEQFRPHSDDDEYLPTCTTTAASSDSLASAASRRHFGDTRTDHFDDTEVAGRVDELDEAQEDQAFSEETKEHEDSD